MQSTAGQIAHYLMMQMLCVLSASSFIAENNLAIVKRKRYELSQRPSSIRGEGSMQYVTIDHFYPLQLAGLNAFDIIQRFHDTFGPYLHMWHMCVCICSRIMHISVIQIVLSF